jgi:hypothetical protein
LDTRTREKRKSYWCALKRMKNWRCSTEQVIFVLSSNVSRGTLVKDVIIWSK